MLKQESVRVVIAGGGTGGHVQPAIAVSDVLRRVADVNLTWIGSGAGVESAVAEERDIPFLTIPAGKLRRYFSVHTLFDAIRVPVGILRARMHLRNVRPDVVYSTGGFVSVPTVIAAWLAGIPVITHEQTATLGLANRINARLSNLVALAFESTRELVPAPAERIVVTGNPVRGELLNGNAARAAVELGYPDGLPVLYVTGGSLGAHVINDHVRNLMPELVEIACVVHQCGPSSANGDFPRLLEARLALPERVRDRYVVRERIGAELADVYDAADLVVGRSGAGTVAELACLGKPAILIPLPGTSSDEQTRNAQVLQSAGGAILIPQSELSPESLLQQIRLLLADSAGRVRMSEAVRSVAQPNAATMLASEILKLADHSSSRSIQQNPSTN